MSDKHGLIQQEPASPDGEGGDVILGTCSNVPSAEAMGSIVFCLSDEHGNEHEALRVRGAGGIDVYGAQRAFDPLVYAALRDWYSSTEQGKEHPIARSANLTFTGGAPAPGCRPGRIVFRVAQKERLRFELDTNDKLVAFIKDKPARGSGVAICDAFLAWIRDAARYHFDPTELQTKGPETVIEAAAYEVDNLSYKLTRASDTIGELERLLGMYRCLRERGISSHATIFVPISDGSFKGYPSCDDCGCAREEWEAERDR